MDHTTFTIDTKTSLKCSHVLNQMINRFSDLKVVDAYSLFDTCTKIIRENDTQPMKTFSKHVCFIHVPQEIDIGFTHQVTQMTTYTQSFEEMMQDDDDPGKEDYLGSVPIVINIRLPNPNKTLKIQFAHPLPSVTVQMVINALSCHCILAVDVLSLVGTFGRIIHGGNTTGFCRAETTNFEIMIESQ